MAASSTPNISARGSVRLIATMKVWRLLLQSIGALNLALSLCGGYFLSFTISRQIQHPHVRPGEPFFRAAFWTMCGINILFLVALIFVSVMLLKLRPRAALVHTCLFLALIFYVWMIGPLWLLPGGVGSSIAGASGVADMGVALLTLFPVPYLYPLLSVVCVNIARYRLKRLSANLNPSIPHE